MGILRGVDCCLRNCIPFDHPFAFDLASQLRSFWPPIESDLNRMLRANDQQRTANSSRSEVFKHSGPKQGLHCRKCIDVDAPSIDGQVSLWMVSFLI